VGGGGGGGGLEKDLDAAKRCVWQAYHARALVLFYVCVAVGVICCSVLLCCAV